LQTKEEKSKIKQTSHQQTDMPFKYGLINLNFLHTILMVVGSLTTFPKSVTLSLAPCCQPTEAHLNEMGKKNPNCTTVR
jgi:hypothetical protein